MSNVTSSMAVTARQSAIRSSANQRECQIYREAYAHEQRIDLDSGFEDSDSAQFMQMRDADERLD